MPDLQYKRTGRVLDVRKCPRHEIPLELSVLDASDAGTIQSLIAWHCARCLGYWHEAFFIRDAERDLEPAARSFTFGLSCPVCGSFTTRHACEPGCCDSHVCDACGAGFDAKVEVIVQGTKQRPDILPRYWRARMQGLGLRVMCNGFTRTGVTHPLRDCPEHHSPTELIIVHPAAGTAADEANRLGWYCEKCELAHLEVGAFMPHDSLFTSVGCPTIECPVCGGFAIDSIEARKDFARARCVGCDSELRVTCVNISRPSEG